jgi:hypothetical protein
VYCCQYCFNDSYLREFIQKYGTTTNCSFCNHKNTICIRPSELSDIFLPIINLYSPIENIVAHEKIGCLEGKHIWERLQEDWNVFSKETELIPSELFKRIISKQLENGEDKLLRSYYERERDLFGSEDEEANKLELEWKQFSDEMKSKNRFFPSIEINLEELEYLLQYLDRKFEINEIFFRARISASAEKYTPKSMGKPPENKAKNGRANPVGIPYLYLASSLQTSIAEIRSTINDFVTVGKFKFLSPISVIDLRDVSPFQFTDSEDLEILVNKIGYLKKLGEDLSKPINQKDSELEYLPTQYLSEFIKKSGWDGVAFKSSLSDGYNLTIFSDKKCKCTKTELYKIGKSKISYQKCG